ncbi:MAG: Gfo/Idh/MocA family protein [Candidatus Bathyarchaeia archaeon]|nr:Gfo/Idh/MocA family oxidoreductase [Candidatus Bathyarchaeota archaeon A05DMB-4]
MSEILKIGIVGGGHIAKHRHIPIFQKMRDVEVYAICDSVESVAKGVASQFGIKHYYTSLAEMLKEDLDVVDINTPPQSHLSVAKEAIEAGCHLLVEKPLAMTVEDVDEMFSLAKKHGVKLCVVHQNLYNPAVQKAVRLVREGFVGDLIGVDVGTYVRRDNYMCVNGAHWCHKLPGGIFFEVLPHPVYLLQIFLKAADPKCVVTKKLSGLEWMKADEARVLFGAENGVGLVVASCNSPYHGDSLNIFGTKMGLQVDLWGRSVIKYKPRTEDPVSVGKGNLSLASQFLGLLGTTVSSVFTIGLGGEKISAHYGFLRAFVDAIQGKGKLPVSEEETRENVSIVVKICRMIDESV